MAMPTLPVFLVNSAGPFSAVITPQTVTAGVLADTTPVATMTASLDDVSLDYTATTEDISAMTSGRRNPVITERGTSMTVGEILKTSGSNLLAAAAVAGDYFKIVFTRGAQAWTGYFLLTGYSEKPNGKGKTVGTATFESVDPGTANPTYA
jgi:hypothetical protein